MLAFRLFLITTLIIISLYTALVIGEHGMGLLYVFFGDMLAMGWPGQFNLDFFCFLLLSGLWMAWRHDFSATGLALGTVAVFGGFPWLSLYLLFAIHRAQGDMRQVLLGPGRAAAR